MICGLHFNTQVSRLSSNLDYSQFPLDLKIVWIIEFIYKKFEEFKAIKYKQSINLISINVTILIAPKIKTKYQKDILSRRLANRPSNILTETRRDARKTPIIFIIKLSRLLFFSSSAFLHICSFFISSSGSHHNRSTLVSFGSYTSSAKIFRSLLCVNYSSRRLFLKISIRVS